MNDLDPAAAAAWAMIALTFILMGALLTLGPLSVEQRAAVLAGIFAVLLAVAYRGGRRRGGE